MLCCVTNKKNVCELRPGKNFCMTFLITWIYPTSICWKFSRISIHANELSGDRWEEINFTLALHRHHDRALLGSTLLMTLPVKLPYMALSREVCLPLRGFKIWNLARGCIRSCFYSKRSKMSLFPKWRMILPAVHRIRWVFQQLVDEFLSSLSQNLFVWSQKLADTIKISRLFTLLL